MKAITKDLPSYIEVDGKTYPLSFRNEHFFRAAMNNSRTAPEHVEANNLTKLAEKIRLWIIATASEKAETQRRKEALETAPPVQAMHAHQRVTIRGWHASQDGMLLVTYPTGKKDKVAERLLLRLDAPVERLTTLYDRHGDLAEAMNDLSLYFSTAMKHLDNETIEIRYRETTDDFEASYKLGETNYLAIKPSAYEARAQVESMIACDLLPWAVSFEGEERDAVIVASTAEYKGHGQGYRTQEDAQRWVELHDQREIVADEIRSLEEEFKFSYDAALEAIVGPSPETSDGGPGQ